MILVAGASGTIGREVVRLLAAGGERVRAMTRNPAAASYGAGVEVVAADFADPESLAAAAERATTMFMLSAPGPAMPAHDAAMLAAATTAGVRKLVKLSAIGTGDGAKVGDWHLPGERAVRSSGLAWTVLRPSSFASNALRWAVPVRAGRPVPNPTGSGTQGVVDPRDVAEVAVRALTTAEQDGRTLTLTGPDLLSVPDMAAVLSDILGRTVATVELSAADYRAQLAAAGLAADFVEAAVDGARLVAEGGNATLADDVARALGRAPRTFAAWAQDHRARFSG